MRKLTTIAFLLFAAVATAQPRFENTIWWASHDYGVNPADLYAIALMESRILTGKSTVAPDPYVLRYGDSVYRLDSFVEAADQLYILTSNPSFNPRLLDVGMLQVNAHWHGHRVSDLSELLIPSVAIKVGSEILAEAQNSTSDPILRLGRYHSYTPSLAQSYGTQALFIACQLREEGC